jgi:hypothetical protein
MMAVRLVSVVAVVCLLGCSGGGGATGAEVPTGAVREDAGATGPADDAGEPATDAGSSPEVDGGDPDAFPPDTGADANPDAADHDAAPNQPPGNGLSYAKDPRVIRWTEGDPAVLYPFVNAYDYGTRVEIEFSSTPPTERTGRRIVILCRAVTAADLFCNSAEIRPERTCAERSRQTTTSAQLGDIAPRALLTGHIERIMFDNALGGLTADVSNLVPTVLAGRMCLDGTSN